MTKIFDNNWASPPGNTISAALKDKGLSSRQFARLTGMTDEFVSRLLSGYATVTAEVANSLSQHLGASTNFWLKREKDYQKDLVSQELFYSEEWVKSLPIKDMLKFRWIKDSRNLFRECLDFFGVASIYEWQDKYGRLIQVPSFRLTKAYQSQPASVATWLRQGELVGNEIDCKPWDKTRFEQSLEKIKPLTRKKSPKHFLPLLKEMCAECGVALAIVRTPDGCRASGATRFLSPHRALIILSFRYRSDDQFWFTFFHEAGHLILHSDKSLFLESPDQTTLDQEEQEANAFAGEVLIPYHFQNELRRLKRTKRDIVDFAMKLNISAGIVIGQMQYHNIVDKKYLNGYKRTYEWEEIEDRNN